MALVESLITAIVRADGDALVMHVGDKPYVVATAGPIELSTQGLNLQAMAGMVAQLLPADAQQSLAEFGAVEHELPAHPEMQGDRFSAVVARGGDDVWIEIRRQRQSAITEHAATTEPAPAMEPPVIEEPAPVYEVPSLVSDEAVSAAFDDADAPAAASMPTPSLLSVETFRESEPMHERSTEIDLQDSPLPASAYLSDVDEHAAPAVTPPAMATMAASTSENMTEYTTPASESPYVSTPVSTVPSTPVSVPVSAPVPVPAVAAAGASSAYGYADDERPTADVPATSYETPTYSHASVHAPTSAPAPASPSVPAPAPAPTPASVIPMTRTLRIEVPPSLRQANRLPMMDRLLNAAAAQSATALYLTAQSAPYLRVDADVRPLQGEPALSSAEIESAVSEMMPEAMREALRRGEATEWGMEFPGLGAIRGSTFRDHRGTGAIFQLVAMRPMTAEKLGLADEVQALATEGEGLVVVAGPRAHGKTTLVGALIDLINRQRPNYVITLERQVRLVHEPQRALISQREVRGAADQVLAAARAALRENPDVLVIEEPSSADVCQLALDAAGSGVLVIVSVSASSTTSALTQLVELFPADKRRAVQSLLSERLRGAVAQLLLRNVTGGRVAAREVLITTTAVATVLGEGQLRDLPEAIDAGRRYGLISLTDALIRLLRSGAIDLREAYRKTDDRQALLAALKRENLDTGGLERLA